MCDSGGGGLGQPYQGTRSLHTRALTLLSKSRAFLYNTAFLFLVNCPHALALQAYSVFLTAAIRACLCPFAPIMNMSTPIYNALNNLLEPSPTQRWVLDDFARKTFETEL